MKFDVVIGNPPYNRGIDIDFVSLGYQISKSYVCMVIPGKWQTAESTHITASNMSYGEFRNKYTKHIRYVCFYPCCKDIFDILQVDGITIILMDKNIHNDVIIENRCKYFTELNSIYRRTLNGMHGPETLINVGFDILQSIKNFKHFTFPIVNKTKRFQVWVNQQCPGGSLSTVESRRPAMFIGAGVIEDTLVNKNEHTASIALVYESDNRLECESFLSWIQSKFVQFFRFINQNKMNSTLTDDCFRFVPAPMVLGINGNVVDGKFDHIYTDEELYKTFNISSEHIKIIETIVKGRKD